MKLKDIQIMYAFQNTGISSQFSKNGFYHRDNNDLSYIRKKPYLPLVCFQEKKGFDIRKLNLDISELKKLKIVD